MKIVPVILSGGSGARFWPLSRKQYPKQYLPLAGIEYEGKLIFDTSKPDDSPRKLIDVSRLSSMGWKYNIDLEDGLKKTYKWYLND